MRRSLPVDFDTATVHAIASNFERTQLSGSSFLCGLLDADRRSSTKRLVHIRTVSKSSCPIAAFESDIGLRERVRVLFKSELFTGKETTMEMHAAAL